MGHLKWPSGRTHIQLAENWVLAQFTVTPQGTVREIAIVDSSHWWFHKPVVRALSKAWFEPRKVFGLPVTARNHQVKSIFKLEGERL